jgi:S-adenosylmethionine hydrolase
MIVAPMIVLFTDFDAGDIYVAQVKASLLEHFPDAVVVDLLHNAPNFRVESGAHLLAALQERFPSGSVFLAVVDPRVGTDRDAVIVQADDKWYVGPDNGLLSVIGARAAQRRTWRIIWRPQRLSSSFHGRDLFAPIAAWIARGEFPHDNVQEVPELQVRLGPDDLAEIIYIDHYGNALTGLRASSVPRDAVLALRDHRLKYAKVFADVPAGGTFWYENSIGLGELAATGASAAALLGAKIGETVTVGS